MGGEEIFMAHELPLEIPEKKQRKRFFLPSFNGRIGVTFSVGTKEVFIGVLTSEVIMEQIIKRKVVKTPKAQTRTYGFDVFSSEAEPSENQA